MAFIFYFQQKLLKSLKDSLGWTHGALDIQGPNILPVLLQQGDQEVDTQHNIADQLIRCHFNMANGNSQAQHLFHLEFYSGLDLINLSCHSITVGQKSWKLANLVQSRAKNPGNLLDQ